MKIRLAHLKEHSTSGGWINFAVFDAQSSSGANSALLTQLTVKARASGLKVDQSALAFNHNGRIKYYGSPNLVTYLAKSGISQWTHNIDI